MSDGMKGEIVPSGLTLLGLGGWVIISQLDKMEEEKNTSLINAGPRLNAGF